MPMLIHGKEYITVAERLKDMHEAKFEKISIETEVLQHQPAVVIKATVVLNENCYTGISAANPSKQIEKISPYEVAETSAVGRALGFAGFGAVDSIASADEMIKASYAEKVFSKEDEQPPIDTSELFDLLPPIESTGETCDECSSPLTIKVSGAAAKHPNKEYWACPTHKWKKWA